MRACHSDSTRNQVAHSRNAWDKSGFAELDGKTSRRLGVLRVDRPPGHCRALTEAAEKGPARALIPLRQRHHSLDGRGSTHHFHLDYVAWLPGS